MRHTLAEAIDRYVREVLPGKPRSKIFQARQLVWSRQHLGHLSLADVTASVISEARARLMDPPARGKRARGAATANRYMAVLAHLLPCANGNGSRTMLRTGCAS
jgi:hypothetical protein